MLRSAKVANPAMKASSSAVSIETKSDRMFNFRHCSLAPSQVTYSVTVR